MELFIEVHDNAGAVHYVLQTKVATLEQLKEKIQLITLIDKKFHQLFTEDGEELVGSSKTSLQSLLLNDGSKVIFKHLHLQLWDEYKECADSVLIKKLDIIANTRRIVKLHRILMDSSFFYIYPSFDKFREENQAEVVCQADEGVQMSRKAIEDYFRNLHNQNRDSEETKFICHFKGSRAFVRFHGDDSVTEYSVRYRHDDHRGTGTGWGMNFAELYCYKLLSLIGVSPELHIIPPSRLAGKETSIYIAIQRDDKLELFNSVYGENKYCADVVVQLAMLQVLLHLSIESEKTGGRWKNTKNAALTVFVPREDHEIYSNIKQEILKYVRLWRGYKEKHDDNYWLNLAKVYFDKWALPSKIELAREQLDPTNVLVENFESMPDQLNEFIDILHRNVENLQTVFNSIIIEQ